MDSHAVFVCVVAAFGSILVAMEVCGSCCDPYRYEEYDTSESSEEIC